MSDRLPVGPRPGRIPDPHAREWSPLTKAQAHRLTAKIVKAGEDFLALLVQAWEQKAWAALKYRTWDEYVRGELSLSRSSGYRLLDQGMVIRAIEAACADVPRAGHEATQNVPRAGHGPAVSQRQAKVLVGDLPAAASEVAEAVAAGVAMPDAVKDVVAKRSSAGLVEPKPPAPVTSISQARAWAAPYLHPCPSCRCHRAPTVTGRQCKHPKEKKVGRACEACGDKRAWPL